MTDDQAGAGRANGERPLIDMPFFLGLPALLGVALLSGIGAGIFGGWLHEKNQDDLVILLESSLTPAAILVSAAWVAIAIAHTMDPAERRSVRTDNLLYTAFVFSCFAVVAIALSLMYVSAHARSGSIEDLGPVAAGLMGVVLGGIPQLMFRAIRTVWADDHGA